MMKRPPKAESQTEWIDIYLMNYFSHTTFLFIDYYLSLSYRSFISIRASSAGRVLLFFLNIHPFPMFWLLIGWGLSTLPILLLYWWKTNIKKRTINLAEDTSVKMKAIGELYIIINGKMVKNQKDLD